ncbi:PAS domain S-box protein [Curvibacter sp. APW13]|uniref:sensor histidine kinase n=1 Tax=Curvibacter sp. APW13 TaxID=3077236 RepID=UPI0028DEE935|nr:PAS domain S-box protein [Curvibacter sp. APW13]MDT8991526.1 PAS domain S-box protein [Curvibacter sp. APW13]
MTLTRQLRQRWANDVFFRIGTTVFLSLTLASVLHAFWAIRSLSARAELELQERADGMVAVLAKALARPLFDLNSLAIASVGESVGGDPQVRGLRVLGADGTVLVEKGGILAPGAEGITLGRDISYVSRGREYRVGQVQVSLSTMHSDQKLRQQIIQFVMANVFLILATCLMLFVLGRQIARPFKEIELALDHLSKGDSDIHLSRLGQPDQLGRLSDAVERFRSVLSSQRAMEQQTKILLEEKAGIADKLKAIYDSSNDAVMLLTDQGFFDCNQRTLDMFGVASREEFVTFHPSDLSPDHQPDGRTSKDAANERIGQAMATGECRFEWMHRRADGKPFPAEVLLSAFEYGGKKVLQATVRDITRRRQTEQELQSLNSNLESRIALRTQEMTMALESLAESRQKLQAIVDTALDAVVRVDSNGLIVGWNKQAQSIFGWSHDEAIGRDLTSTIIPEQYRQAHQHGMARYMRTGTSTVIDRRIEISAVDKAGREFPIELAITRVALEDANKFEFCSFIRDITERKQAEEEIRVSLERQRELIQLKSRFVSMASHEFRTPLATIQSSTDLLLHYFDRLPLTERNELLGTVSTAVRRMTKMLEDILTIGKEDADQAMFNPAMLSIEDFCNALVNDVSAEALALHEGRSRIQLTIVGDARSASMDESILRHIFENLLSNALKYSPSDARVDFDVECSPDTVVFRVRDRGIGIPPEDVPRLFESFHRAGNVGNIPGTGLGLAIVKRSVERHQGTIAVSTQVGEGTTFTVSLPRLS